MSVFDTTVGIGDLLSVISLAIAGVWGYSKLYRDSYHLKLEFEEFKAANRESHAQFVRSDVARIENERIVDKLEMLSRRIEEISRVIERKYKAEP